MVPRPLHVVAVTVLLALAPACGDGNAGGADAGGGATGSATPTADGTTGTGTSTSTGTSTGTRTSTGTGTAGGGETEGEDGFEYVPWGPDDPPVPGHYAAMAASDGTPPRCGDVAEQRPEAPFWTTVVEVCRTLSDGTPWPDATTVPDPPPAENAYIECVDEELRSMVERALRWHAENPGREPRVRYPEPSVRSTCQARIYEVRVLGEGDLVEGEDHPDGVGIAVTGASMSGAVDVTVDGVPVEFTGDFRVRDPGGGLTTVVVLAERPAQPRRAEVQVRTGRDVLTASVELPGAPPTDAPAPAGGAPATHDPTDGATP